MSWELYRDAVLEAWLEPTPLSDDVIDAVIAAFQNDSPLETAFSEQTGRKEPAGELPEAEVTRLVGDACAALAEQEQKDLYRQAKLLGLEDDDQERSEQATSLAKRLVAALLANEEIAARLGKNQPHYPTTTRLDKEALKKEFEAEDKIEAAEAAKTPVESPAPARAAPEAAQSDRRAVVEAVVGKSKGGSKLLYMLGGGALVLGLLAVAIGLFVAGIVFDVGGMRARMPRPVQVALDRTPPVVEILSPTEERSRGQLVKIKLAVRDATLVRVTLNGKEISNVPAGDAIPVGQLTELRHEGLLKLVDLQPREIEVVAVDGAGLRTRVTRKVRLIDPGPPKITLTSPLGSGTVGETVQVAGSVRGLTLDRLTLTLNDGKPTRLQLDAKGQFTRPATLRPYGNSLVVRATDILNRATHHTLRFDLNPPYSGATKVVGALHRRALAGDRSAMAGLAYALRHGRGVTTAWEESRRWFIAAAKAGNDYARGMVALNGWGRARDVDLGAKLFLEAAEAKDPLAMTAVGLGHFEAEGLAYDPVKGEAWLNKAAQAGNAHAWVVLAHFYRSGVGVKRDLGRAKAALEKAAAAGESQAMLSLGRLHLGFMRGRFMRPGPRLSWGKAALEQGRAWYRKAAAAGNPRAMTWLADTYGQSGWTWDPKQVVSWLVKAADAGDSDALLRLGSAHLYGLHGLQADRTKGLAFYVRAARRGSGSAMRRLARLHAEGYEEITEDPAKAKTWYEAERELYTWRATLGDPDAMRRLGDLYRQGIGVAHDPAKALDWYRKAATSDIDMIWWSLGQWLLNPSTSTDELPRDAVEAVKWYRKAAAWGDGGAMRELAAIYRSGEDGVPADSQQATQWFKKSLAVIAVKANRGHPHSRAKLAELYGQDNPGLEADPIKAFEWRRKAAEAGDAASMRKLAELYSDGTGVAKDTAQAVRWLEKAAAKGDTLACRRLARGYDEGGTGVSKDPAKATQWYAKERTLHEQRAAGGDFLGWEALARIYREGIGVKKDLKQAEAWVVKAAETGEPFALHAAATFFREARKDTKLAATWLRRAAEAGDPQAMVHLGEAFLQGKGVEKDAKRAVAWYEKAAARDSSEAMRALGKLFGEGTLVAKDAAKSVRWYRAEREFLRREGYRGSTWMWRSLARIHRQGIGVPKNLDLAIRWLRRAKAEDEIARIYSWGTAKDLAKAAASQRRLAKRGNTHAMRELARLLLQGKGGVGKDAKQAIGWYERAAKKNDVDAVHALARLFDRGLDVERDKELGLRWYRRELVLRERMAWRGSNWSITSLAKLYLDGPKEVRSSAKAATWYERAARKQDTSAIRALAILYEKGRHDLPKDPVKATHWYGKLLAYYRKRARGGDVWAMKAMAGMYMDGKGTKRDVKQAIAWFERAAQKGKEWAKMDLAQRYMGGRRGFPKDVKRALYWYEQAAAAGSTYALARIAAIHMRGYPGVPKDVAKGLRWYRQAAEKGDKGAISTLARIYEHGQYGVKRDLRLAIKWLAMAGEKGDLNAIRKLAELFASGRHKKVLPQVPTSRANYWYRKERAALSKRLKGRWVSYMDQYRYGDLLRKGKGGPVDHAEAAKWIRKAAARNYSEAMNALGELYEHGQGVPRSYKDAAGWYRKATYRGSYRAYANLGYLYERGLGVRKNPYEAYRLYSRGGWRDGMAAFRLASLYERGLGVRKDLKQAQRYYVLAAKKGIAAASKALARLKRAIELEIARKKALELERKRKLELARKAALVRRDTNIKAAHTWIAENVPGSAEQVKKELAAALETRRNHAWLFGEGLTKSGQPVWLLWHDGAMFAVPLTPAQARTRKVEPKGIGSTQLGPERSQAMNTGLFALAKPVLDGGLKVQGLKSLRGKIGYKKAGKGTMPAKMELQGYAPLAGVRMILSQPAKTLRNEGGTFQFSFGTLNYPGQVHFKGPVVLLLQVWASGGKTRAHPVSNTIPVLIEVE